MFQKGRKKTGGRLKGTHNAKDILFALSEVYEKDIVLPSGKTLTLSGKQQIMNAMYKRATKGDIRAAEFVINREDGMPAQTIQNLGADIAMKIEYVPLTKDELATEENVKIVEKDRPGV